MKKITISTILILTLIIPFSLNAQIKIYSTSGGELIFSKGQLAYTAAYQQAYPQAEISKAPVRFTCFFHLGQQYHFNLSRKFGFFSGFGVRNIGMISNEVLPTAIGSSTYFNAKIVRRTYSLGIPFALKFGSMDKKFFIYGGGEIEWAFDFKRKYWDSHSRSGTKSKYTDFRGRETKTFLPSAEIGIQFPKGMNLKFKYYLTDFLNNTYSRGSTGTNYIVDDLTRYKNSHLAYIALSWQIEPKKVIKKKQEKTQLAALDM